VRQPIAVLEADLSGCAFGVNVNPAAAIEAIGFARRASLDWTETWTEDAGAGDAEVVTLPEQPVAAIQIAPEQRTAAVAAIRHTLDRCIVASD